MSTTTTTTTTTTTPPLSTTTLLIIDSQTAFNHPTHWGPSRSNPAYETNISTILSHFRSLRTSPPPNIIHIRHSSLNPSSPLHPSSPGFSFHPSTTPLPSEPVLTKSVNSAFIGTDLEDRLRAARTRRLVVVGLTTDHCVSTTVRMAGNLGVVDSLPGEEEGWKGEVIVVGDATACWKKPDGEWDAEVVHAVHLESLREFASVWSTERVVREIV